MPTHSQLIMIGIVSFISAFGGFVQWIRKDDSIRTKTELVKTVSTGIFTGVLSFVALTTLDIDIMLRYVLAGLASYIGGSLLDMSANVATKIVERKVGLDTSGDNAEHLDQIANVVHGYNKPSTTVTDPQTPTAPQTPTEPVASSAPYIPAPPDSKSMSVARPSKQPRVRPGEIPLAEYESELLKEAGSITGTESTVAEPTVTAGQPVADVKPKRKRASRKKTAPANNPQQSQEPLPCSPESAPAEDSTQNS